MKKEKCLTKKEVNGVFWSNIANITITTLILYGVYHSYGFVYDLGKDEKQHEVNNSWYEGYKHCKEVYKVGDKK